MIVSPEGINISLKLPESLLRFVGVCLSLAGITVCLHHSVHVLTHLHHLSAVLWQLQILTVSVPAMVVSHSAKNA